MSTAQKDIIPARQHGRRKGTKNTDHAGRRYGRLTMLFKTQEKQGNSLLWNALCDCGKKKLVNATDAMRGKIKSCGCELYRTAQIDASGLDKIQDAQDELQVLPWGFIGQAIDELAEKIGCRSRIVESIVYGNTFKQTGIGGCRGKKKKRGPKSEKMNPQWESVI